MAEGSAPIIDRIVMGYRLVVTPRDLFDGASVVALAAVKSAAKWVASNGSRLALTYVGYPVVGDYLGDVIANFPLD